MLPSLWWHPAHGDVVAFEADVLLADEEEIEVLTSITEFEGVVRLTDVDVVSAVSEDGTLVVVMVLGEVDDVVDVVGRLRGGGQARVVLHRLRRQVILE